MAAAVSPPLSVRRKLLAGTAMAGAAGIVVREALNAYHVEWMLLAFGALTAVAGFGITRASLVPQVLSRGLAWLILLPTLVVSVASAVSGHSFSFEFTAMAVGTATALLLSRPMLFTKEARAAFAPRMFRHWLLSGSMATSAAGVVAGGLALAATRHQPGLSLALAALAASFLASAIGVVRMRAWGILLGALTSMVLLVLGLFNLEEFGLFALAASPALLLHTLPVLVARWMGTSPRMEATAAVPRYRIATETNADVELETSSCPLEPQRAMLRAGSGVGR